MEVSKILKEIDSEIARLQEARDLLAGGEGRRSGRASAQSASPVRKRRRLSAEGRKKIADAMKRRWMERKKAAAAKAK